MEIGDYVRLDPLAKNFLFPIGMPRRFPFGVSDSEATYALSAFHSVASIPGRAPMSVVINMELGDGRVEQLHIHESYLTPASPLELLAREA